MTALILPKPHFQTFLVNSPQVQVRCGRPCPLGTPFSMPSFKEGVVEAAAGVTMGAEAGA